MNKVRDLLLVILFATNVALTTGIVMDHLDNSPTDTVKASGAAFVATSVVGISAIKLLREGSGSDSDDHQT